jgi:hypothetical protein
LKIKTRSIFRKNIGRALLNKDKDPFLSDWELDLTARKAKDQYSGRIDMGRQRAIEKRVSNYIQSNFSFVVAPVTEKEQRLQLEARLISILSLCGFASHHQYGLGNFRRRRHEACGRRIAGESEGGRVKHQADDDRKNAGHARRR